MPQVLKDPRGDATSEHAAPLPAPASETGGGEIEHTAEVPRKRPVHSQVVNTVERRSGRMTPIQVRRIVASLEAGHAERNIAEAEHIPEHLVRRVRVTELDKRIRQMKAVSVAVGDMLETIRELHGDIDRAVYEELLEDVA